MSQHISVAVFGGVDDFLKCCNRFWQHPPDLVKHLWEIRAFLLYFFVDADLLQLQLYLYDVSDASASVSGAVFNNVDTFLKCCMRR